MCINYDRSAAYGAHWQNLELKFRRLLQYGNMRARRGRVVYASLRPTETCIHGCIRPTEAACFCVRICANNHQLIVAGVQRFLRPACAARFRVIHTSKTLHALRVYMQTLIGAETVIRKRVLHDDEICFTSMDAIFKRS